jgi:hypothetical protein
MYPPLAWEAINGFAISWGLLEMKKVTHPCDGNKTVMHPHLVTR